MSLINYQYISESIRHYEVLGYNRVEAHWWVPEDIMMITAPKDREGKDLLYKIEKNKKCLVASGEQSFLYMANQGMLVPGKYQTVTPCFRDELQGPMRRKYFLKNELINTQYVNSRALSECINDALAFFASVVPDKNKLKVVAVKENGSAMEYNSFDIEYDGVELGSYGIRSTSFLEWVYATGCAEPRLSRAIAVSEHDQKIVEQLLGKETK